jgi:hypothetical protein
MSERVKFIVYELGEETESFVLHLFAAMAERERLVIGARTKAALAAAKARGVRLGGPNINQARVLAHAAVKAIADRNAANVLPIIEAIRKAGATSLHQIAEALNARGVSTPRGGRWHAKSVAMPERVLRVPKELEDPNEQAPSARVCGCVEEAIIMKKNKMPSKAVPLEVSKVSKVSKVPQELEDTSDLRMPTLGELLKRDIPERQCLLNPWLREHESCLLYAATGVGKSLFALSAALAVAGKGCFLGWKPDDEDWRVLYVDGEQHIGDIQDRARMLMDAVPDISKTRAQTNIQFLARQDQDPAVDFPEITDAKQGGGQERILQKVLDGKFNLLILDNFSTLGVVEDENKADSFNSIQSFLLKLKTERVATILVHHTGKSDDTYRGSTKLAATFEVMLHLKRYRGDVKQRGRIDTEAADYGQAHFELEWSKLRSQKAVGKIIAKLTTRERQGEQKAYWEFTRSLEHLYAVKEALQGGLLKTKAEIAAFCKRTPPAAERIINKGVRYRLWTDANVREWLTKGAQRRQAGETTAPTAAGDPVFPDDDEAEDL